jgi:hypothetical protein
MRWLWLADPEKADRLSIRCFYFEVDSVSRTLFIVAVSTTLSVRPCPAPLHLPPLSHRTHQDRLIAYPFCLLSQQTTPPSPRPAILGPLSQDAKASSTASKSSLSLNSRPLRLRPSPSISSTSSSAFSARTTSTSALSTSLRRERSLVWLILSARPVWFRLVSSRLVLSRLQHVWEGHHSQAVPAQVSYASSISSVFLFLARAQHLALSSPTFLPSSMADVRTSAQTVLTLVNQRKLEEESRRQFHKQQQQQQQQQRSNRSSRTHRSMNEEEGSRRSTKLPRGFDARMWRRYRREDE